MKGRTALLMLVGCLFLTAGTAAAQKRKLPRVCGNPEEACPGRSSYQPYDLPVVWPQNSVVAESEPFYAIVLKSAKYDGNTCGTAFSNSEIQSIQNQFPLNKVFANKCGEPGENYYTGVDGGFVFIAVFAGRTKAQADKFLKEVKDTGQYPGVRLRKMRVGVNGT